jgi:hypothetical protein
MKHRWLISFFAFFLYSSLEAGSPVWTFTPLTPTTISVAPADNTVIQYRVTNQSLKTHTLAMTPINGISQDTTAGNCPSPFTLAYQQSCTLTLTVQGSTLQNDVKGGPIVCQQGSQLQCYQPSSANRLNITRISGPGSTTLSASVIVLALSVNDTGLNPNLTGNPRIITITNTGGETANDLDINFPTWPSGTTATSNCGSSLLAGGTCTITVTPGSNSTSGCNAGTPVTPGEITISASNASSIQIEVMILSYGCVVQNGYLFSIDDTTPTNGSISGSTFGLSDQSSSIIWSSNGNGGSSADVSDVVILGIDQTSTTGAPSPTSPSYPSGTPPFTPCNGATDGECDATNIISYYDFNRTAGGSAPTPLNFYAAGLCDGTINGFDNWYLPAVCQLGYSGSFLPNAGCGSVASPLIQNVRSNLVDTSIISLLGSYWSSTEVAGPSAATRAWAQSFGGIAGDISEAKSTEARTRCVRDLTL